MHNDVILEMDRGDSISLGFFSTWLLPPTLLSSKLFWYWWSFSKLVLFSHLAIRHTVFLNDPISAFSTHFCGVPQKNRSWSTTSQLYLSAIISPQSQLIFSPSRFLLWLWHVIFSLNQLGIRTIVIFISEFRIIRRIRPLLPFLKPKLSCIQQIFFQKIFRDNIQHNCHEVISTSP